MTQVGQNDCNTSILAERTLARTACNTAPPAKSKMAARGPQNYRVLKGGYPYIFGCSHQLSLNKFFDPSTPSMSKVDDVGEDKGPLIQKQG